MDHFRVCVFVCLFCQLIAHTPRAALFLLSSLAKWSLFQSTDAGLHINAEFACLNNLIKHDIIKKKHPGEGFHSKKQNKKMNKRNTCGILQRYSCQLQIDKHIKQNHCVPLSPIYNFFSFFKFFLLTRTSYRLVLVMCFSETNFFLGDMVHSSLSHIHFPPLIQSLTWYGKVKHWSTVVTVGGCFQAISMLKPKAMSLLTHVLLRIPWIMHADVAVPLTHTQHVRSPTTLLCLRVWRRQALCSYS